MVDNFWHAIHPRNHPQQLMNRRMALKSIGLGATALTLSSCGIIVGSKPAQVSPHWAKTPLPVAQSTSNCTASLVVQTQPTGSNWPRSTSRYNRRLASRSRMPLPLTAQEEITRSYLQRSQATTHQTWPISHHSARHNGLNWES
jgi:hypothetical protein